jgi:hypothetical protein
MRWPSAGEFKENKRDTVSQRWEPELAAPMRVKEDFAPEIVPRTFPGFEFINDGD